MWIELYKSVWQIEKKSKLGIMDGQEQLSVYKTMLENLISQPENLSILEKLAGDGDADVAYMLGWCYFKGEYLPKDFDKSMAWLEKPKR